METPLVREHRFLRAAEKRFGMARASELQRLLTAGIAGGHLRPAGKLFTPKDYERFIAAVERGRFVDELPIGTSLEAQEEAWVRGKLDHPAQFSPEYWDHPAPPPFIPPAGVFRYEFVKALLGRDACVRSAGFEVDASGVVRVVSAGAELIPRSIHERATRHWDRLERAWDECWERRWNERARIRD
jgi:hypothetical protein